MRGAGFLANRSDVQRKDLTDYRHGLIFALDLRIASVE